MVWSPHWSLHPRVVPSQARNWEQIYPNSRNGVEKNATVAVVLPNRRSELIPPQIAPYWSQPLWPGLSANPRREAATRRTMTFEADEMACLWWLNRLLIQFTRLLPFQEQFRQSQKEKRKIDVTRFEPKGLKADTKVAVVHLILVNAQKKTNKGSYSEASRILGALV